VILRSEVYTQKSICHITGLTEHQVRSAIQQIRQRFSIKPEEPKAVLPFRVYDRKTGSFTYVHSLEGTNRKHLRVMRPTGYVDVAASVEPVTRGAYGSYNPPGVLTALNDSTSERVGPLHFAGGDTSPQWPGYMDGAIRSGKRAAAEALGSL